MISFNPPAGAPRPASPSSFPSLSRRRLPPIVDRGDGTPLRVAIIGHLKFPISRPFMGGLERFTDRLVRGLSRRGVEVTLFATADSDADLNVTPVCQTGTVAAGLARFPEADQKASRDQWVDDTEDAIYSRLMDQLSTGSLAGWFDVIHNNSINPVPLAHADRLSAPCTTTLHVPVLPRLKEQIAQDGPRGSFVNISGPNREQWAGLLPNQAVIANAVDIDTWRPQPLWRRPRAIWYGRILPDKGTHFAIEAAHRIGLPIDIAGPVSDDDYYRNEVLPRLQPHRGDRMLGNCETDELQRLVGRASVCFVTPCWEEPFGLVAAEAMSCGTPVAAFDRGGPAEIVGEQGGRLSVPEDVDSLADAAAQCLRLDRQQVRREAVTRFDEQVMIDRYIDHYYDLVPHLKPTRLAAAPAAASVAGLDTHVSLQ